MILYYVPGACSQASHIALIEAGIPHRLVKVGWDKQTDDGRDFKTINAKGYTPALELDDGTILTEGVAILTFIADQSGKLLASSGLDRWRALEAAVFIATEIHSNFRPLFYPDASEAERDRARRMLAVRFATITEQLGDKMFLIGDQMTIADTYLFVVLGWAARMEVEVSERLSAYSIRLKRAPSVAKALVEEGLT